MSRFHLSLGLGSISDRFGTADTRRRVFVLLAFVYGALKSCAVVNAAIPPATDIPEEVLRTEVITEARSPIDGKPLSAAEFAELVIQIQENSDRDAATLAANNPKFKEIIFLLRLRGFLRSVGIPIK